VIHHRTASSCSWLNSSLQTVIYGTADAIKCLLKYLLRASVYNYRGCLAVLLAKKYAGISTKIGSMLPFEYLFALVPGLSGNRTVDADGHQSIRAGDRSAAS
jgi:hypothetical protein